MSEEEMKQIMGAYNAINEINHKLALKAMFNKENANSDLKDFNLLIRYFCWIKTVICLLLKRTDGSYLDDNKFCIATFGYSSCPDFASWESIWVSPLIFKDWNVCVCSDGN